MKVLRYYISASPRPLCWYVKNVVWNEELSKEENGTHCEFFKRKRDAKYERDRLNQQLSRENNPEDEPEVAQ